MKCAGRYKQNVIGFYGAVLSHYRAAFDYRQNVTLNALSGYVRTARSSLSRYLIYFVYKYNALLLRSAYAFGSYVIHIYHFFAFAGGENF